MGAAFQRPVRALWIPMLLLVGCAPSENILVVQCSSNPCALDQVCLQGRCVDPTRFGPDRVHLEIRPQGGGRTQLLDVSLSNGENQSFDIPKPSEYEVRLLDGEIPIPARLTLVGRERIPGREVELSRVIEPAIPSSGKFGVPVGSYTAFLKPLDESLPAIAVPQLSVRGPQTQKDFSVPKRYRHVSGRVRTGLVDASGLQGARIYAVSQKNGLVSTTTVSNAFGEYSIVLPHTGPEDTSFRLMATPPAERPLLWSFEQSFIVREDEDREIDVLLEEPAEHRRGLAELKVFGEGSFGLQAVPYARVTLTATTGPGLGRFSVTGTTDNEGLLWVDSAQGHEFAIIGARYQAKVEPAAGSSFGRLEQTLDLTGTESGVILSAQLVLPLRTKVSGQISSGLGRPVVNAQLVFDSIDRVARPLETTTDSNGAFELELLVGRYLMIIHPLSRSDVNEALPTHVRIVEISEGRMDALPLITLPPAALIEGRLNGAAALIANAELEFFVELGGRVISIGMTRSDAFGRFSVFLPSSL